MLLRRPRTLVLLLAAIAAHAGFSAVFVLGSQRCSEASFAKGYLLRLSVAGEELTAEEPDILNRQDGGEQSLAGKWYYFADACQKETYVLTGPSSSGVYKFKQGNFVGMLEQDGDWLQGPLMDSKNKPGGILRLRAEGDKLVSNFKRPGTSDWTDDKEANRISEDLPDDSTSQAVPFDPVPLVAAGFFFIALYVYFLNSRSDGWN